MLGRDSRFACAILRFIHSPLSVLSRRLCSPPYSPLLLTTLAHHYIDFHIHYHNRTSHEVRDRVCRGSPMLTLSEAEHGVYHNRRVSDALRRHRIFDTTPTSTNPLIPSPLLPLTSYLLPLTSSHLTSPLLPLTSSTLTSYPLPLTSPLLPLHSMACSGQQPCRRYGCGGCLGETAIVVNPTLSIGDA